MPSQRPGKMSWVGAVHHAKQRGACSCAINLFHGVDQLRAIGKTAIGFNNQRQDDWQLSVSSRHYAADSFAWTVEGIGRHQVHARFFQTPS